MSDEPLIQPAGTFKVTGTMRECCKVPANLGPVVVSRNNSSASRRICRVCGARHIRLHAEPVTLQMETGHLGSG